MSLDDFDREFAAQSGNAQDIMKCMLGLEFNYNNSRKYLSGIRHYLSYKENLNDADAPKANEMSEISIRPDGSRTTKRMLLLSEDDSKDSKRLMTLMGYDPLQWELVSCKVRRNYWDVTIRDEGKFTNHAFMVTVTCKPIQNIITTEYIKELFESMTPPKLERVEYIGGNKMLELPIYDIHLAGSPLNVAIQSVKDAVLALLSKVEAYNIEIECIKLPIGQDFFHADNHKSETTRGTRVETVVEWDAMYKEGVELLIWMVETLRQIAPVECFYVPGNHDMLLSYYATMHLSGWFRNTDDVIVDTSSDARKYIEYGDVLIGLSHGVNEKKRIEYLMQIEQPEAWGRTSVREFHLGHLHSEHAREVGGIIHRRISTITLPDRWHKDGGWLGAIRKVPAFVWDKNGEKTIIESRI